jgi:hypothetical protein
VGSLSSISGVHVRVVHTLLLPTLVAGVLAASGMASSGAPSAHLRPALRPPARAGATLVVTTQGRAGVPKVSPRLDGANPRWMGDANGILTKDGSGLNPRTEKLMKVLGLRSLRYPGGTVSNLFDHRRFGDPSGPQCQTSGGFARPFFKPVTDSFYSPALNAQFTDDVGAVTNLMLPMVNTTPDLARGFVNTVKQGQAAPLYVEVGNEPYLPNQRYWRSNSATTRLHQYLSGATAHQPSYTGDYAGNTGLFRVTGCNLKKPVKADGAANQVYRPRFWPIALGAGHRPTVKVAGQTWRYVAHLSAQGPSGHVFTVTDGRSRVLFGDGVHGAKPSGAMSIDYSVAGLGFSDFYRAVHQKGVKVCASWGRLEFATLAGGQHRYDCLTFHSYATGRALQHASLPTAYVGLRTQVAERIRYEHRLTRAIRQQGKGAAKRFLMVTEYGTLKPIPHQGSEHLNDLLLAQQMIGQVAAGVRVSNISNFDSLLTRASNGTTYLSSRARLLQLVNDLAGLKPRVVHTSGGNDVQVLATRDHGVTRLLVLNMRPGTGRFQPALRIPGLTGTQCVAVRRLAGGLGANDGPLASTGLPATAHLAAATWRAGTGYRPAFPNHSVTSLTVSPKGSSPCRAPRTW